MNFKLSYVGPSSNPRLTEKERENANAFIALCRAFQERLTIPVEDRTELRFEFRLSETSLGMVVKLHCEALGVMEDITDYESW